MLRVSRSTIGSDIDMRTSKFDYLELVMKAFSRRLHVWCSCEAFDAWDFNWQHATRSFAMHLRFLQFG